MILNPATRNTLENLTENNLSFILYGTPGCGKGTFVDTLIADIDEMNLMWIDASKQNIDWIRDNVERFCAAPIFYDDPIKYVVFNEANKLHTDSQELLKGIIENYFSNNRFVFMTNHYAKIDEAIKSRLVSVEFRNPPDGDVIKYFKSILACEGFELDKRTEKIIKAKSNGYTDFRKILNELENFLFTK
jgi:DNA polymerase III delta prime subunit